MSEEQFREQLVDYLYGELEGAPRAAFEDALAASPERRAELEALRATLRSARTGLASLSEDPPARLRGAILDAERSERAGAGRVLALKPWYRRGSTIAPALAAAAALAFAVLAPRKEHQLGDERSAAPVAPQSAPSAVPAAEPASTLREQGAPEEAAEAPRELAAEGKGKLEAPSESAGQLEARRAKKSSRAADAPRAERAMREERADDRAMDAPHDEDGFAKPPPGWGATNRSGAGRNIAGGGAAPSAAAEPRDLAEREPPAAAPPAPAPRSSMPAGAPGSGSVGAPASSEGAAVSQPPAKRADARRARAEPSAVQARSVEEAAKPSADAKPSANPATRAPDALVARAQEHVKARRWADAVIAYRELLQRYPRDERAAAWRSELAAAARALTAVPLAP